MPSMPQTEHSVRSIGRPSTACLPSQLVRQHCASPQSHQYQHRPGHQANPTPSQTQTESLPPVLTSDVTSCLFDRSNLLRRYLLLSLPLPTALVPFELSDHLNHLQPSRQQRKTLPARYSPPSIPSHPALHSCAAQLLPNLASLISLRLHTPHPFKVLNMVPPFYQLFSLRTPQHRPIHSKTLPKRRFQLAFASPNRQPQMSVPISAHPGKASPDLPPMRTSLISTPNSHSERASTFLPRSATIYPHELHRYPSVPAPTSPLLPPQRRADKPTRIGPRKIQAAFLCFQRLRLRNNP